LFSVEEAAHQLIKPNTSRSEVEKAMDDFFLENLPDEILKLGRKPANEDEFLEYKKLCMTPKNKGPKDEDPSDRFKTNPNPVRYDQVLPISDARCRIFSRNKI